MAEQKISVEAAGSRLPVPDPTALTTAALLREIAALKELSDNRLDALEKLMDQKFVGIKTQIDDRDIQTDKASRDVKSAVDAAFAAAKEAVGEQNKSNALSITKSEAATTKQIDLIFELIKTNTSVSDGKVADIKDRLQAIESHSKGIGDGFGWIVGLAGIIIAVVVLMTFLLKH